jgi:hypothetical protein
LVGLRRTRIVVPHIIFTFFRRHAAKLHPFSEFYFFIFWPGSGFVWCIKTTSKFLHYNRKKLIKLWANKKISLRTLLGDIVFCAIAQYVLIWTRATFSVVYPVLIDICIVLEHSHVMIMR